MFVKVSLCLCVCETTVTVNNSFSIFSTIKNCEPCVSVFKVHKQTNREAVFSLLHKMEKSGKQWSRGYMVSESPNSQPLLLYSWPEAFGLCLPNEAHPASQPGVRALGFFILFVQFWPSFCMRTKVSPGTLSAFPILESFAVNLTVISNFHLGLHLLPLLFIPSLTQTSKPVAGAPLPGGWLPGGQWSVCLSFWRKSASAFPKHASSSSWPLQPTWLGDTSFCFYVHSLSTLSTCSGVTF